ncbi:50S ribosomal protein L4 [bacterium]|nr:50S ribosomal protein L4 [candidate division CSSED10-310 bacterium]
MMPVIDVVNSDNEVVDQITLNDAIFGVQPNPYMIQEVIRMQQVKRRAGTACTKDRGEVNRTTAKFFRQKGTGRARRGSLRSPVVRGGGVVFGPKPRSYEFRPPRKVRRSALRMALSLKLSEGNLVILDDFHVEKPETKSVLPRMTAISAGAKALVVVPEDRANFVLSVRNSPKMKTTVEAGLNVLDVVRYDKLILFKDTIPAIEEALQP